MSAENHNTLASMLFRQLAIGTDSEAEALIVLESLTLGVLLLYRGGDLRAQAELLDAMTARVIERLER